MTFCDKRAGILMTTQHMAYNFLLFERGFIDGHSGFLL